MINWMVTYCTNESKSVVEVCFSEGFSCKILKLKV